MNVGGKPACRGCPTVYDSPERDKGLVAGEQSHSLSETSPFPNFFAVGPKSCMESPTINFPSAAGLGRL